MGKRHTHQKRMSIASEKTAAGQYGRLSPRSGADARRPGDVEWPHLLLEDKMTGSDKFYVTTRLWDKIAKEAKMRGRMPCVRVTTRNRPPVVVIRQEDFTELTRPYGQLDPLIEVEQYTRGQSVPITPHLMNKLENAEILVVESANECWVVSLWRVFEKINDNYVEQLCDRRPMEDH